MKTTLSQSSRRGSGAVPEVRSSPAGGLRAARQGQFWPGENFALLSRHPEPAASVAAVSFVLTPFWGGGLPK